MPLCLVPLCLSVDRELNLICSVLSPTLSVCIKTFWTYPWVCLYKIMLCSRAVVPKWGDTQEGGAGARQSWTAALEHERDCRYLLLHVPQWAVDTGQRIFTSSSAVRCSSNLRWRYQSSLQTLHMKGWIRDSTVRIKWHRTVSRNSIFVVA